MKFVKFYRFDEVFEFVEKILDNKVKLMVLNQIVVEFVKVGEDYFKVFIRVIEVVMNVIGQNESIKMLMGLVFDFFELGMVDDVLKIVEYIFDLLNRVKVEVEVVLKLVEKGEVVQVMEIIENIFDEDVKIWVILRFVNKF